MAVVTPPAEAIANEGQPTASATPTSAPTTVTGQAGPSLGSLPIPLQALTAATPNRDKLSKAITAILRHECKNQAFTIHGLQSKLRFSPTPTVALIEDVLRGARRDHAPRFRSFLENGEEWWHLNS